MMLTEAERNEFYDDLIADYQRVDNLWNKDFYKEALAEVEAEFGPIELTKKETRTLLQIIKGFYSSFKAKQQDKLVNDPSWKVRLAVAKRTDIVLTPEQQDKLANDPDPDVRQGLAENPNCLPEVRKLLE